MTNKRILVVSPSGNFYGSEQVLMDHLRATSLTLDVAAPQDSLFIRLLRKEVPRHRIIGFDPRGLTAFYLRVAVWIATGRYDKIYFNEAGHGRYAGLLAKAFPGKRFIIHVRIVEDTVAGRLPLHRSNVTLVTISKYMKDLLGPDAMLEYDPYPFSAGSTGVWREPGKPLRIGVIGRITATKGVQDLLLLTELVSRKGSGDLHFLLFGEEGPDVRDTGIMDTLRSTGVVKVMGFVNDKEAIYRDLDVVLHLSRTEPLGRIFFEAMDHRLPLVGFRSAGIGEIGEETGLLRLLVDPSTADPAGALLEKLLMVRDDPKACLAEIESAMPQARRSFSLERYTTAMDKILCT